MARTRLSIRGRAIAKDDDTLYNIYGYLVDKKGKITHISVEPNGAQEAFEPLSNFKVVSVEVSE